MAVEIWGVIFEDPTVPGMVHGHGVSSLILSPLLPGRGPAERGRRDLCCRDPGNPQAPWERRELVLTLDHAEEEMALYGQARGPTAHLTVSF